MKSVGVSTERPGAAMKISVLVWGLVGVIAFSGVARSQSLADVARKE
jgi:hypothetical protein